MKNMFLIFIISYFRKELINWIRVFSKDFPVLFGLLEFFLSIRCLISHFLKKIN